MVVLCAVSETDGVVASLPHRNYLHRTGSRRLDRTTLDFDISLAPSVRLDSNPKGSLTLVNRPI